MSARSQHRSKPRGFGLVEAMASASLLAVAMTAIVSLLVNLQESYRHQRLVAQALHVAEGSMEELLVRYADDVQLRPGVHTGPSFGVDGQAGGAFFTTSWSVIDGVPFTGLRRVTITVQWTETSAMGARPRRLQLATVRT
jgi:Tfp pilus assembly protein PilV